MRQIDMIDEKLGRAQGWGTWDMLGGGLISDLAKHSNLDEAQAGAEYLQTLLSRFRTELADVRISAQTGQVNVEGFLRFADYFFDGLIADWTVLSRIHKSRESVSRSASGVRRSRLRFIRAAGERKGGAGKRARCVGARRIGEETIFKPKARRTGRGVIPVCKQLRKRLLWSGRNTFPEGRYHINQNIFSLPSFMSARHI